MSQARFSIITAEAITDENLTDMQLRVLSYISTKCVQGEPSSITQGEIATALGVRRESINRAVKRLSELGYVKAESQRGKDGGRLASKYSVCLAEYQTPHFKTGASL